MKSIPLRAIKSHTISSLLHTCKRQNVCNAFRVIPDSTVTHELADQVCTGHTSIAVNIHHIGVLANICDKTFVTKHINSGLIVQQDPVARETTITIKLHGHTICLIVCVHIQQLVVHITVLVIKKVVNSEQCCPGLSLSILLVLCFIICNTIIVTLSSIMSLLLATMTGDISFVWFSLGPLVTVVDE